ncbi:MAG: OmpH family outer membrane protein [Bacteroidaceae bacterium]|nr:OmpH family outer membrane protein [Bacteroidaceae bacterium]
MRKIIAILALLSCAGTMSAQDTALPVSEPKTEAKEVIIQHQHFGYLSFNEVMKAMPEYAQAIKSLEELKDAYDKELERSESDFSKKYAEYIDGQKSFPENIMLKRQKELQMLMDQSIQFKKEALELLAKSEEELMQPVTERLKEAIAEVGKANKYAFILNTDANAYPYISSEGEAEDCTDAVLTKLGIK